MNKVTSAALVALLGIGFSAPSLVNAATTSYTPSITIVRTDTVDNQAVPKSGVNFTITPVELDKQNGFDLTDTSSFNVLSRGTATTFTTDSEGKVVDADVNTLPAGFYEITEEGQKPIYVALPYKDDQGVVKDDLIIYPKTGLTTTTPVSSAKSIAKQVPASTIMQTSGMADTSVVGIMIASLLGIFSLGFYFQARKNKAQ